MSHVVKVALQVKDLDALDRACCQLSRIALVRGAQTFRTYQEGIHCDHKITIPGEEFASAYEIGVVKQADGTFEMVYDEAMAYQMNAIVGQGAAHLKQEYAAAVSTGCYEGQGYYVSRQVMDDGRIVLEATR